MLVVCSREQYPHKFRVVNVATAIGVEGAEELEDLLLGSADAEILHHVLKIIEVDLAIAPFISVHLKNNLQIPPMVAQLDKTLPRAVNEENTITIRPNLVESMPDYADWKGHVQDTPDDENRAYQITSHG